RGAAPRLAAVGIRWPGDAVALLKVREQSCQGVVALTERPPTDLRPCPSDVIGTLAVAGLASDADFRPGGRKAVACGIVVPAHTGRVALGTHEIPVLAELGPMQHVVVTDVLVWIEMEPALATLLLGPGVPGERKHLQAAVRKLDQILL